MDGIDKMLAAMQKKTSNSNKSPFSYAVMTSANACKMGTIALDADDLLIPDYLVNGYIKGTYIKVTDHAIDTDYEEVKPLKAGDEVVLARINDGQYMIIGRVVTA